MNRICWIATRSIYNRWQCLSRFKSQDSRWVFVRAQERSIRLQQRMLNNIPHISLKVYAYSKQYTRPRVQCEIVRKSRLWVNVWSVYSYLNVPVGCNAVTVLKCFTVNDFIKNSIYNGTMKVAMELIILNLMGGVKQRKVEVARIPKHSSTASKSCM